MPMYYFHVHSMPSTPDYDGCEHADLDAAKAFAMTGLRELLADDIKSGHGINLSHSITIADAAGLILHKTGVAESVQIHCH